MSKAGETWPFFIRISLVYFLTYFRKRQNKGNSMPQSKNKKPINQIKYKSTKNNKPVHHYRKSSRKPKLSKKTLFVLTIFRFSYIFFIVTFALFLLYYKANVYGSDSLFRISRYNLKNYYKKTNTEINITPEEETLSKRQNDKIYTINILNNECVSDNQVNIKYECSERANGLYDRYKVSISGNNIVIDKTYNSENGHITKETDLMINYRNIESINDYLSNNNEEKVLEFTKNVYNDNVQIIKKDEE